jgi:intracellular sulfur oxidation DsrE/DsrF family protein
MLLTHTKQKKIVASHTFSFKLIHSPKHDVMANNDLKATTDRRRFLGSLATGAAAVGLATFTPALSAHAENNFSAVPEDNADAWFNKVKGKHRIVFDVPRPNEIMPFAWPRVFLMTNGATGTPDKDCGVVVVFRHEGIPYAFEDRIWEKYKFGEMFKANDPKTKAPSTRNPFWKPQKGDYKVPGIGEVQIGINELQASGVMFCVCNAAMTVYTAVVADQMKMDAADVMKDWKAGLLPGVQIVPSGVWAVGRAQEHNCRYCYAG